MALSPEELIDIAPEAIDLVKTISKALKKDADGKVRVTREEAREIRTKVFKLAVEVAQHAID
jgi:vacuolar-type H+-ATPase subunit H